MGQLITVEAQTVGDIAIFDTNRSVSGQDGEAFDSVEAAAAAPGYPAQMAARLFDADSAVRHVFVLSNGVTVARDGGWDDRALTAATDVIRTFFVYYRDGVDPAAATDEDGATG